MWQMIRMNWQVLRVFFTALGILLLVILVPWAEGVASLKNIHGSWFAIFFLVLFATSWADAYRVESLLNIPSSLRLKNLNLTFKTALVAQFPSGIIGGELFRVIHLSSYGFPRTQAGGALIVCRFLTMAALLLVGVICLILLIRINSPLVGFISPLSYFALIFSGSLLTLLCAFIARYGGTFVRKLPTSFLSKYLLALDNVGRNGFLTASIMSVLIVLLKSFIMIMLLIASGSPANPIEASLAIVAGSLLSMVPITIAAIGARESGIAGILILNGVPVGSAFSLAVALRVIAIATAALSVLILSIIEHKLV